MNLQNAINFERIHISVLRDLAGALRDDPNAVDWELAEELMTDSLGCGMLGQVAAVFVLDPLACWQQEEKKILQAIIQASESNRVRVEADKDEDGWLVRHVFIHGIGIDGDDLTMEGIDRAISIAAEQEWAA